MPAATAVIPEAASMAVTRPVTVVLPLVPVMAKSRYDGPPPPPSWSRRRASSTCPASSISLTTSTPEETAATRAGWPTGTPGLGTTSDAERASSAARAGPGAISTLMAPATAAGTARPSTCRHRLCDRLRGGETGLAAVLEHDDLEALCRQPGDGGATR